MGRLALTAKAWLLLFAAAVAPWSASHAACKQADLRGNWYFHAFFTDAGAGIGYWLRCKLVIGSSGSFSKSSSSCRLGTGGAEFGVAGSLLVRNSCQISNRRVNYYDGLGRYAGHYIVNLAVVDAGKSVISGVGGQNTRAPFIFTAVRP